MYLILAALAMAVTTAPKAARTCDPDARELIVDLDKSLIRWRGTKFWGLGKHEGTVRLKGGAFCSKQGRVVQGWFEADMRSIEVTDIPASDPVPRRRLTEHLLGDDFFAAETHPVSRFILREVHQERGRLYRIAGDMTIRGRTRPLTFYARGWSVTDQELKAQAGFKIDRHQFGVSYRGSTLKDDLVDDEFELELVIEARPPTRPAAVSATKPAAWPLRPTSASP
jgi:polyisoprenoid-binding protein YceI